MNYATTIRQLQEKRDFYAAAVRAMEAIQTHENGVKAAAAVPKTRRNSRRSRIADADIVRTLALSATEAAHQLNTTVQTIYTRRNKLKTQPVNGGAGDPIAVQ